MSDITTHRGNLVDVGALTELEHGVPVLRTVANREVAIVRWGDEVFAIANGCPHQGGPLCQGHVGPFIQGEPDGTLHSDPDRPIIACAWHGWEFGLRDGVSICDTTVRTRAYRVEIIDGRVRVGSRGSQRPHTQRERDNSDD